MGSIPHLKVETKISSEVNNFEDNFVTGGFEMDQNTVDQGWQQLQAHVQGFLGQFLKDDAKSIEYKPQFSAPMLEMTSPFSQSERQDLV